MTPNVASVSAPFEAAPLPTDALRRPSAAKAWTELFKVRLNALVLLTSAVGFHLATNTPDWLEFAFTLLGTALTAAAASALNQYLEIDRDARMPRTKHRPLPAGDISPRAALAAALALGGGGVLILAILVNLPAASLALGCLLLYVLVYTPLKTRTPLNTLVGAVVGAIPPLVGWVGATGRIELGGIVLAGILFIWQIPHFLALAWMYREQYAIGGFRMLPHVDPSGAKTCQAIIVYSLALLPMTLLLSAARATGIWYAAGALLLGLVQIFAAFKLYGTIERSAARRVFLTSVVYLPLLLALMVFDRAPVPRDGWQLLTAPPTTARTQPVQPVEGTPALPAAVDAPALSRVTEK